MEETANDSSTSATAPRPALISVIAWFRDLMLSVLIAVLVILFLYRPVKVEGTSMMPTLLDQERLFINQFSYKFGLGDIKRGDTVVFWYPDDATEQVSYIKRVIGLPGDTVEVKDGYVLVNGKQLQENYVPLHRISSNDSRAWGFVPRDYIYGKAVFVFWPLEHLGSVR